MLAVMTGVDSLRDRLISQTGLDRAKFVTPPVAVDEVALQRLASSRDVQALSEASVWLLEVVHRRVLRLSLPGYRRSLLNGLMVRLEDSAMVQGLIVDLIMLIFALEGFLLFDLTSNVPVFVAIFVHLSCRHLFVHGDRKRDRICCRHYLEDRIGLSCSIPADRVCVLTMLVHWQVVLRVARLRWFALFTLYLWLFDHFSGSLSARRLDRIQRSCVRIGCRISLSYILALGKPSRLVAAV